MQTLNMPINVIIFPFCEEAGKIMIHFHPLSLVWTKRGREKGIFYCGKKTPATSLAHEKQKTVFTAYIFPRV